MSFLEIFTVLFFVAVISFCVFVEKQDYQKSWLKWVAVIIIVIASFFAFEQVSIASLKEYFSSWTAAIHLGIYFGIGLLYSVVEFSISLFGIKRKLTEKWEAYLNGKNEFDGVDKTNREWLLSDLSNNERTFNSLNRKLSIFAEGLASSIEEKFVYFVTNNGKIEVKIDLSRLSDYIFAWSVLWPFYLIVLVLDDIIFKIVRTVSNAVSSLAKKVADIIFKDAFKV